VRRPATLEAIQPQSVPWFLGWRLMKSCKSSPGLSLSSIGGKEQVERGNAPQTCSEAFTRRKQWHKLWPNQDAHYSSVLIANGLRMAVLRLVVGWPCGEGIPCPSDGRSAERHSAIRQSPTLRYRTGDHPAPGRD
jgi:hypothetical protein